MNFQGGFNFVKLNSSLHTRLTQGSGIDWPTLLFREFEYKYIYTLNYCNQCVNVYPSGSLNNCGYIIITFYNPHFKGSWKESLRTSFKNFRRDHPTEKRSSNESPADQIPAKKLKTIPADDRYEDLEDEDESYDAALTDLTAECKKGRKGNQVVIKRLMAKCEAKRRNWITTERPLISDVLKKFPPLSNTRMVTTFYS